MTAGGEEEARVEGYWDIDRLVAELGAVRSRWRAAQRHHAEYGAEGFPSRANIAKIMLSLCGALFPLRLGPSFVRLHNEDAFVAETLQTVLSRLYGQIRLELIYAMKDASAEAIDAQAARIIGGFAQSLPGLRELLDSDVEAAFLGDPAARNVDEVLICYPSILAIIHHRLAHRLHDLGAPLVARIVSEIAHSKTGIDIHPARRSAAASSSIMAPASLSAKPPSSVTGCGFTRASPSARAASRPTRKERWKRRCRAIPSWRMTW